MKKIKLKNCPICEQKMDLIVTSHKNSLFVDNKTYDEMCFTCYSVPKTVKQILDKEGCLKTVIDLEYSIDNLHSARELFEMGSADNLNSASTSLKAVKKLKVMKSKKTCKMKPALNVKLP